MPRRLWCWCIEPFPNGAATAQDFPPKADAETDMLEPERECETASLDYDQYALVPRPSCVGEKVELGSKPVFLVLAGADHFADVWRVLLQSILRDRRAVRILQFETDTELIRLAREHRFDLVSLYLGNILWTEFKGPHQGDWLTNDFFLQHMVGTLAQLHSTYGKPIVATQGMDWSKRFSGTGVLFLQAPFQVEEIRRAVESHLPSS